MAAAALTLIHPSWPETQEALPQQAPPKSLLPLGLESSQNNFLKTTSRELTIIISIHKDDSFRFREKSSRSTNWGAFSARERMWNYCFIQQNVRVFF